eukprot:CAMPEP_0172470262 /NCGR_PEP_ID=MMETSP1065-20121228/65855_1 /TAXON_ID=265537 /ORGANISM="Amphiprora paludosa, Strain CCMP125" /LENGTH=584 /DNA_ID=CAMNT_0013228137 /DNA_START=48 /DNA_END=1802 /DNA_ORIENTATION=+
MVKPKKILNDPSDSVEEFIEGLLLQYPNHMAKLQNHNVILAASRDDSHVQLISGGGSGHEPSHAGWLGAGMLSAAVCGGIFASPSVSSVLAAIRATATEAGVLLIIKNYTGDRLNFGMAAEKAGQEGIRIQTIVVAEDCALPRTKGITGSRGVAGTVFVHKIAGAAAAAGKSLDEVAALARLACSRMGSLGVAMDSVTVPGADSKNDRLDEKTIEIGLGIHGEAGMKQSPLLSADEIAKEMVSTIQMHGREQNGEIVPLFEEGDELAILVNNLGGSSNYEMSILARSCLKILESKEYGAKASRVFVGSFMTSFDMHGASLTILNLSNQPELTTMLDAVTSAPAWMACDVWNVGSERPSSKEIPEKVVDDKASELIKPPLQIENFSGTAQKMISAATDKLAEAEPTLTKYDTIVGDGDCGLTMKRGATEVNSRLANGTLPLDHPVSMYAGLADAVSASMGGTSGVLLELMFRKMSSHLSFCDSIGVEEMNSAVQAGVDAVSLYGGATLGSRTMLDALIPSAAACVESAGLLVAAAKAKEGAESTASMGTASAGRSNYLSEDSLSGTPDPGAVAVSIVLEALASTV